MGFGLYMIDFLLPNVLSLNNKQLDINPKLADHDPSSF